LTNENNPIKLNNERRGKTIMNKEKFIKGLKTTGVMAQGIVYFLILAFVVWSVLNLDVMIKTIRFPEAVRELKIDVRVSQLSK